MDPTPSAEETSQQGELPYPPDPPDPPDPPIPPKPTEPPIATNPAHVPTTGLLVTNHLNLYYMLAAGLVMPPSGFGNKYYEDSLNHFPGWIPLFVTSVPREAIQSAIKEADYLRPCIVEFSLTGLSGPIMGFDAEGPRRFRFPEQFEGSDRVLLIPAPLPVSLIASIIFPTNEDRKTFETDAEDYTNVSPGNFKLRTRKGLFTKTSDLPWPPSNGPEARTAPLEVSQAAGGVIAMLLLFANLSEQAVHICRLAFDPDAAAAKVKPDPPMVAGLRSWIREGKATLPEPKDPDSNQIDSNVRFQAELIWKVVERLVTWQHSDRSRDIEHMIIEVLSEALADLEPETKKGLSLLRDTLVSLTELGDATVSELLDRHDSPLAHSLTLFFLRRDCAELFEFENDRLVEQDWLLAAILFGVRDGWMKLPNRLRTGRELTNAVSHRMSLLSHRIAKTDLDLGEVPARVRPLREVFGDGSTWRTGTHKAAQELSKAQKWDCVQTRIRLVPGEYQLIVNTGSVFLELPGAPKITPQVNIEEFFRLLARSRLDHKIERKIRKMLPV